MPTLHRGSHFVVVHNVASGYVSLARTELPFAGPSEAELALAECDRALQGVEAHGILLDWRRAPLSTDPRLHKIFVEQSDVFVERFGRGALLTKTPVGSMQGARIVREQSATSPVMFLDEAVAVAYVCGQQEAP